MFLLALLFFLLGTSVFSAPPTERHTKVGKVDGGYPEHQPVLEAEKRHVGLWYPVDGKARRDAVIQILPSGQIRRRKLSPVDGAILEIVNGPLTPYDYNVITTKPIKWRRFPTRSTGFVYLLDCLSVGLVNGNIHFDVAPCSPPSNVPRTNWATGDFNYWYKVPLSSEDDPYLVSAPVLQFTQGQVLTGICHLGANGGVDLSVIVRHPHFNPDDIKGRYRRVPNPNIPLKLRGDEMRVGVDEIIENIVNPVDVVQG